MDMKTSFVLNFPPFRLDLTSEQLWHTDQPVALRPKTFAVLRYLVEHPGQLVTKDALLDAVWADAVVSDTVLKSCIRELRMALDDDVQTPRFIATVHRRGYRFIGKVAGSPQEEAKQKIKGNNQKAKIEDAPSVSILQSPASPVVGREPELLQLQRWWNQALGGERQLVFVTGEAGIGKTTLVDAFLCGVRSHEECGSPNLHSRTPHSALPSTPKLWLGRGQCIEHYGAGEAYMPILEALGRLCREPGGERLIVLLNQHAPTWLVQMPTVLTATEFETVQRKVQGATRERMLREMGEAIEAITAERPLVLWLEDLHWSDPSTLELLALLARRRETARLLVIGTYRPVDVIVNEHPLKAVKQELHLHGQCQELAMRLLTEEAVAEYLAMRFSDGPLLASLLPVLAHAIHERMGGRKLTICW
jgi:DNA-binding winged helix-turn-helix (wHTH) protein